MRWMLALAAAAVWAQEPAGESTRPAVLEYQGQPIQLPTPCTEADIRALNLTCPAENPCPVYLELAEMERVGEKIFLTGNLHTDTTTLASVLLASNDSGKSWYEAHGRIRSGGLDLIVFYDLQWGWAAGYLVHALPRDPFLLITSDGGKTWRRRPVWAESKIGVIEHFYFESRDHGWLWIDRATSGEAGRYELYESKTGGESWMLRQIADQPIAKRGVRAGNPDWRLRADAASKSYVLERREQGRWRTVAGFLIPVGECREAPPTLIEPPEATAPEPAEPPKAPAPRQSPSLKRKPE